MMHSKFKTATSFASLNDMFGNETQPSSAAETKTTENLKVRFTADEKTDSRAATLWEVVIRQPMDDVLPRPAPESSLLTGTSSRPFASVGY
jgi:hypothetical protein